MASDRDRVRMRTADARMHAAEREYAFQRGMPPPHMPAPVPEPDEDDDEDDEDSVRGGRPVGNRGARIVRNREGTPYLVAPLTLAVPGTFMPRDSPPTTLTSALLARNPAAWNGRALRLGHGGTPLGTVRNAAWDGQALTGEAWLRESALAL
jgi:hypothetical protein